MKRIISGLLALCLLSGLPVLAASGRLALSCQERGGEVRLTLEGLDRQVYALQLELVLEGDCPGARFESALRGAYSPDCHVEAGRDETVVTIYLVAEKEALEGRSLDLGTLTPGGGFRLPGRAELLLLDRNLQPISEGRVPLEEDGSGEGDLSRVHIAPSEHGTVTVRPAGAKEGETVTLSVTPDAGYTLESISARDSRDREVSLARDGLNRYTFSMPALDVEVAASFAPGGELAFQDVRPGDWCYDAVRWAFEAGLMNGTSATAFTPDTPTTRGQIVAILYRLEGSPAMGMNQFSDVAPGAYYASAVSWASANGIVNGYTDGTFRPNNLITREQMAAFLYRYASQKGRDVSDRAELGAFTDAGQAASYAVEPLRWAVAAGMVNGVTADTLSPGGSASRAQVAVILNRFVQNVL
ncbi:MAG: S-layer homology domain-containing protein [Oscillibacter sp.]|jgi:hypothetical protein|uniref:S-layer homology domain-containing protein n=1 Tax=uncultured Oscillibacter sp. TaxID=876091 RepID=UPI002171C9B6|nr:S-layer homology domain-containing protein [uncultured Oscillibacter sp.]MCI9643885.1 S-layer homology domain-containing protein [Oscillibacter sp.]